MRAEFEFAELDACDYSDQDLLRMTERCVARRPSLTACQAGADGKFEQEALDIVEQRRDALRRAQCVMDRVESLAKRVLRRAGQRTPKDPGYAQRAFWTLIHYQAAELAGLADPPRQKPNVSPEGLRRIAKTKVPFGPHRGKTIQEAPRAHLQMLATLEDPMETFRKLLAVYLQSTSGEG